MISLRAFRGRTFTQRLKLFASKRINPFQALSSIYTPPSYLCSLENRQRFANRFIPSKNELGHSPRTIATGSGKFNVVLDSILSPVDKVCVVRGLNFSRKKKRTKRRPRIGPSVERHECPNQHHDSKCSDTASNKRFEPPSLSTFSVEMSMSSHSRTFTSVFFLRVWREKRWVEDDVWVERHGEREREREKD